jgi:hypothetical protein
MNIIDSFILEYFPKIIGVLIILLAVAMIYALVRIVIEKIHDNFLK